MFNKFFFKNKEEANKGAITFIMSMFFLALFSIMILTLELDTGMFSEEIKYNKNADGESKEVEVEAFRGEYIKKGNISKFISEEGIELKCDIVDNDKESDICFKYIDSNPYLKDTVKIKGIELSDKDKKYFSKKMRMNSEIYRYNIYAEKGSLHKEKKENDTYIDVFISEKGEELRCDNVFSYEKTDVCAVVQVKENRGERTRNVIGLDNDSLIKEKVSKEY